LSIMNSLSNCPARASRRISGPAFASCDHAGPVEAREIHGERLFPLIS